MSHPKIINRSSLVFEPLFVSREDGYPTVVPVVKATYTIGTRGKLLLAERQETLKFAGERWGPGDASSYKYEPETAFVKLGTDVVLIGSAVAPRGFARELDVRVKVGHIEKSVKVIGDRTWVRRIGGAITMTDAKPFERIPLQWERAFGGWDRSRPEQPMCEMRNPVGTGFRARRGKFEEGIQLPNVEDPKRPLRSFDDAPPPAGLGFTSPDWHPRASLAGTYDDTWRLTRMPLLPDDFDRRFFSAAAPGLTSQKSLLGNEPVVLQNVAREPIAFLLPGVPTPECKIRLVNRVETVPLHLDTVIINTDDRLLVLLWRSIEPVLAEPERVRAFKIEVDGVPIVTQTEEIAREKMMDLQ